MRTFGHETAKGVFVITKRDGTTERFRDNPARTCRARSQDRQLRPPVKNGRPVYIYLCREQLEP